MNKVIERIRYWGQLLLLPVYWFSFLFPRSRQIWLFGSTFGRRFADNPRYLYLYVSQHSDRSSPQLKETISRWKQQGKDFAEDANCKEIRPIWISHDKGIVDFLNGNGYEAYYYHSWKGIWYCLRGKIYIFDNYSKDISFWLSGGARKINMWHGVGNKQINYDNVHDLVRHPKNAWERFLYFPRRLSDEKPSHYILSTSPMMSKIFARAFQTSKSHVIETGYPRNDILFDTGSMHNLHMPEEENLQEAIAGWKREGKKVIGYIPTFRPSERQFLQIMDLETFNHFLENHHMHLVCKLHPKSQCRKAFEQIHCSHITVVNPDVDVNSFLGKLDLLIADYSSVYSDYLLLDRPVVVFHYDFAEYSGDTRDAYFDWEEYMPGNRVTKQEELEQEISTLLEQDDYLTERQQFRGKLYKDLDNQSARRFLEYIQ